ncbi:MAG: hypothetical protein VCF08_00600, partial [Alphaproteobacteria bacterium]
MKFHSGERSSAPSVSSSLQNVWEELGFGKRCCFLVILLVVAEEISEYLAVLNDNFLNFVLILLECLILSPLAISIHRKILIDENISAEFTFTKKQYCIHSWPSYSHPTEYYSQLSPIILIQWIIFGFLVFLLFLLVTSILLGRISV